LNNSDEKVTNQSIDNILEAKQNELLANSTTIEDNGSVQNEKVNDNKIDSNQNETTKIQTQPKDNIDVEQKTSITEVPLLKTSSERAVEKLNKSTENISLMKEPVVSTEESASVNKAVDLTQNESPQNVIKNIIEISQSKPQEQNKIEEKSIEEQVVEILFDEENNINNNKVVAIELFKHDISEQELAKVEIISQPQTNVNIEDRVYKTSLDQFVIKPV